MRIMIKEVGKAPYIKEVEDSFDYKDMQEIVGGLIENLSVTDRVDMWLNDEGKLLPLPTNIFLSYGGKLCDSVQGDIFFTTHNDEGDTTGLDEEDEKIIWSMFNHMLMCHDPYVDGSPVSLYPVLSLGGDEDD